MRYPKIFKALKCIGEEDIIKVDDEIIHYTFALLTFLDRGLGKKSPN